MGKKAVTTSFKVIEKEESMMTKVFFTIGSISGFLAVAVGAFAAHFLKEKLSPEMFSIFEVGVRYHMYHALGLFVVAWAISYFTSSNLAPAGWLFIVGTIIFSGSLYVLSLSGTRWWGMVTPIGGLCFLAGWFWMAWSIWREL